ncbi:MAG: hypothetical protein F6K24_44920 [Okeania sp. SIO2D1]|nr:hypothetical protein [Okeania sp. SIO2D1]
MIHTCITQIMAKLILELPDNLQKKLLLVAKQKNISLERLILNLLTKLVTLSSKDSIENLFKLLNREKFVQAERNSFDVLLAKTKGIWLRGDGLVYQERIREEW